MRLSLRGRWLTAATLLFNGDFRPEQLSQLLGRRTPSHVAGFCQLVSDRRIGQHCIGISADLADGLTWCLGRNEQRLRRHNFVTWDILGDGGHIRGCHIPRRSSARQEANLPRPRVRKQCAAAEVAIDATRYEVRESRRCAPIGHVRHLHVCDVAARGARAAGRARSAYWRDTLAADCLACYTIFIS